MATPDFDWPDHDIDDEPDDDDLEEECGRWLDGRLSSQCSLAGTEWCDWECPIGLEWRKKR